MGGQGSGKHKSYDGNLTIEEYQTIDIRDWYRRRFLFPGSTFIGTWSQDDVTNSILCNYSANKITLFYTLKNFNSSRSAKQHIEIQWTSCHIGGKRPWFICPTLKCKRKVAILYAGNIFACRKCYNLTYPSQYERLDERATRRANKIRDRLRWVPGLLNGDGSKPKGMHWKTFQRLCDKHTHLTIRSLGGAAMRLKTDLLESTKPITRRHKHHAQSSRNT